MGRVRVGSPPGAERQHGGGMALKAGDRAPEFTLPRVGGGPVSLAEYRGGWAVLVFMRYLG